MSELQIKEEGQIDAKDLITERSRFDMDRYLEMNGIASPNSSQIVTPREGSGQYDLYTSDWSNLHTLNLNDTMVLNTEGYVEDSYDNMK